MTVQLHVCFNPYPPIVRIAHMLHMTSHEQLPMKTNTAFHFTANTNVGLAICSTENFLSKLRV